MALPINIDNLITGQTVEWDRIEFKKGWNPEAVMKTICAFANDINNWNGGYIIIGIEETNGIPFLPPYGINDNEINPIQKKIIELSFYIEPNLSPITEPVKYQDKNIVIIWVPGGDNRPYKAPTSLGNKSNKVYWIRRGSTTIEARGADERRLLELASKTPFDDRVNHKADLSNFNNDLIKTYLKEVRSDLIKYISKLSRNDLSRKMNIARGPQEYLKPLNVGLLMFNEHPDTFFRGATIEVVIYEDEVGDNFLEKTFVGPLHILIRDTLQFIKKSVIKQKVKKIIGQAEALRFDNYPFEALEEALVNAVYHKSYEHQSSIEVSIRTNKIEILSFPGPLPPLDNEVLKKPRIIARDYRNRRIGDFLKELRLTEGRGTGIPKIRARMKQNGSPEPTFETNENNEYFLTILPIHPEFTDMELDEHKISILNYCIESKSRREILNKIGITNHYENYKRHVLPLIKVGYLDYTLPDIPNSRKQKYITNPRGIAKLKMT